MSHVIFISSALPRDLDQTCSNFIRPYLYICFSPFNCMDPPVMADDAEDWLVELMEYNRQQPACSQQPPCSQFSGPTIGQNAKGPQPSQEVSRGLRLTSKGFTLGKYLDSTTLALPRTQTLVGQISQDARLSYNLPRVGSTAGQIIQHSQHVIESVIERKQPATFKIGYSHDPVWRFHNSLYGYAHGRDRFEHLCVVYMSHEYISCAFLEAALIQLFKGDLHK